MLGAAAGSRPVSNKSSEEGELLPALNTFILLVAAWPTLIADYMMQAGSKYYCRRSWIADDAERTDWRQRRSLLLFRLSLHCCIFLSLLQLLRLCYSLRMMHRHGLQQLMVLHVVALHFPDLDSGAFDLFESHCAVKHVFYKSLDCFCGLLGQVLMLVCQQVDQEHIIVFWVSLWTERLIHVFS